MKKRTLNTKATILGGLLLLTTLFLVSSCSNTSSTTGIDNAPTVFETSSITVDSGTADSIATGTMASYCRPSLWAHSDHSPGNAYSPNGIPEREQTREAPHREALLFA